MSVPPSDKCSRVSWRDVTDKPGSFPPWRHKHLWHEIYNRPNAYPPLEHQHSVDEVVGLHQWQQPVARLVFTGGAALQCIKAAGCSWQPSEFPQQGSLYFSQAMQWPPHIISNSDVVTVSVLDISEDEQTVYLRFASRTEMWPDDILSLLIF